MKKLCIDCRHFRRSEFGSLLCMIPAEPSPVDGRPIQRFCESERNAISKSFCGPEAKFFQPAEKVA